MLLTKQRDAPRRSPTTVGSVERPWESSHVLSLAKLGCLPILVLWTRRASSRDRVCTGSVTYSRDRSGDRLPKISRDPLGVGESRDLPTVTCSSRLGTESWVRNRRRTINWIQGLSSHLVLYSTSVSVDLLSLIHDITLIEIR
jgi:hypothetical protein